MAAPIASQVLGEVLPYLQVRQDYTDQIEVKEQVPIPDLRNKSIKEAEKIAKEAKLNLEYTLPEGSNKEEIFIKEQNPKPGITVNQDSNIHVEF